MAKEETRKGINRAFEFVSEQQKALDKGTISEADWFDNHNRYFTKAYLAATNPRAQSGHSGDEQRWRYAREIVLEAVHKSGTFLDIGCANGHLVESLAQWLKDSGRSIEFHGLDISKELVALAKKRLPHWQDRFFVGNALYWTPASKYDFIRTGLEYVPVGRQRDYVKHLFKHFVAEEGRLVVGTYNEERHSHETADKLRQWGYSLVGSFERAKPGNADLCYKLVWIDRP